MWEVVLLSLVANHCISSDWFLTLPPKAGGSSRRVSKEHNSSWSPKWLCSTLLFCSSFLSGVRSQHSQLSTQFNATVQPKISVTIDSIDTPHQVRPREQRSPVPPAPLIPMWKCHLGCPLRLLPDLILCLAHTHLCQHSWENIAGKGKERCFWMATQSYKPLL